MKHRELLYCFLFLCLFSCKEHFESPVKAPPSAYLVVEGHINTGKTGGTSVVLSRMSQLRQPVIDFVKGALVQVESETNQFYNLSEKANGVYSSESLVLDSTKKYRLVIKTPGKEYRSSFTQAKATPVIDSISWNLKNDGLEISVNAHDDKNETKYYRWDYVQTWEIHAMYLPNIRYRVIPLQVGFRYTVEFIEPSGRPDTSKFRCWQNSASSSILLGSTARLSKDVMKMPIIFIPRRSQMLSVKYSVFMRQFALSKEEYEFLDIMRKNTEVTGSVFDPQPSQLKGNIVCTTDPLEPVIGFIGVSSLQEKRIYINNSDLPGWGYNSGCEEVEVRNISDSVAEAMGSGLLPTLPTEVFPGNFISKFNVSRAGCVDCTLFGVNKKPDFWP